MTMTTTTTDHLKIAESIAKECRTGTAAPVHSAQCARQGDVVFVRVGDADADDTTGNEACPRGGWLIAAGQHGEHRLLARRATFGIGGTVTLPSGGHLVHTDAPCNRHGAISLAPGQWAWHQSRELRAGEVVRVVD